MEITLDTWIISDTHFGHANIIKYCNRPKDCDAAMFANWVTKVKPEDTVLHLGDLCFAKEGVLVDDLIPSLPGQKFLLRGNHDKKKSSWYKEIGFTIIEGHGFWFNYPYPGGKDALVYFSHVPDEAEIDIWTINVHGHIHNNGYPSRYRQDRDYRNVSVEVMNYEPVRLRDILLGDRYESIADAPINTYGEA